MSSKGKAMVVVRTNSKKSAPKKVVEVVRQTKSGSRNGRGRPRSIGDRARDVAKSSFVGLNSSLLHAGYSGEKGWTAGFGSLWESDPKVDGGTLHMNRVRKGVLHNTTAAPKHPEYGAGIRVIGSQFLSLAGNVNAKKGVFQDYVSDGEYDNIPLNPDIIGGQMALDARDWSYFVFRKVGILYNNYTPDTTSLGFAVGYSPDAANAVISTHTYNTVQSLKDCVAGAWKSDLALEFGYSGKNLYSCEVDVSSVAGERESEQGIIYGMNCTTPASTSTFGEFVILYVVDYYARSMDQGFTVSVSSQKVYDLLVAKLYKDKVLSRRSAGLIDYRAAMLCRPKRLDATVPEWLSEEKSSYIHVDEKECNDERKEAKKILPLEPYTPSKRASSTTR